MAPYDPLGAGENVRLTALRALLGVSHNSNGTQKAGSVTAASIATADAGVKRRSDLMKALGFKWESFPIEAAAAQSPPSTGTPFGAASYFYAGEIVTGMSVVVSTAGVGTTPTLIKLGLLDSAYKCVVLTGELKDDAKFQALGRKDFAYTAPYTILADGVFYPVFLLVGTWGTTTMQMAGGSGYGSTCPIYPGGVFRMPKFGTSKTDLPAVGATATAPSDASFRQWWFGIY